MNCRVVAISRTLGSGAEEIGHDVSHELGFRYIDSQIIDRAAEKAGVSPATMEKAERTAPLLDRILNYLGSAGLEAGHGSYVPPPVAQSASYEALIEDVIKETAAAGEVVIVAHGASIPLAGSTGLLRVFVTASPEVRAARLARKGTVKGSEAKRTCEHSDRERRNFLERFYQVREELPTHYDVVINTDLVKPDVASALIVEAARRM